MSNIRKYVWTGALALAGCLALPAAAQYQQPDRPQDRPQAQQPDRPQYQQDQNRPDQDRDRENRDRDRADRDRNRADHDNPADQDARWRDTKAYKEGMKDGRKDHDKNRGERADRRHWKNDDDRQAYEAGYRSGYQGYQPRDRDDRHDRNDHPQR